MYWDVSVFLGKINVIECIRRADKEDHGHSDFGMRSIFVYKYSPVCWQDYKLLNYHPFTLKKVQNCEMFYTIL